MAGTPRAFGSDAEGRGASRKGCGRAFCLSALLLTAACAGEAPLPKTLHAASPAALAAKSVVPPWQTVARQPAPGTESAAAGAVPLSQAAFPTVRDPLRAALAVAALSGGRAGAAGKFPGMERAQVARLLGKPDFVRRDAPAEIWQYRAGGCILDLFLYEEKGAMRVAHAALRGRTPGGSCGEAVAAGTEAAPPL